MLLLATGPVDNRWVLHLRQRRTTHRDRLVVGLEIDAGAIAAAAVTVNGKVLVTSGGSLDLPADVVPDGEVVDVDGLSAGLSELWGRHKGLDNKVRVGIANTRIVVRTVNAPNVANRRDLATVVRAVAADELPMALDSAVLAWEPVGVVQTPAGERMRVVIVAARREMVENVLTAVRRAGLKPHGVDLSAFAMIRALGSFSEGNVLYLSVGGMTNLAVAVDGVCVFTRVTGGGLETMAIELAERRGMTVEDARMWLWRVGLDEPARDFAGDADVFAAARAVLVDGTRRVANEVRASMAFYDGQPPIAVPGPGGPVRDRRQRRLLTGPAANLPGFKAALEAELGLPFEARIVGGAGKLDDADLSRVTVAAGLALQEARP